MKLKADVACNFYRLIETEGFLKVTDSHVHCKVVISRKQCMTETLLLQTMNRKWYMTYRTAANPITLSDLQGHSPVASLFIWDFFVQLCSSWEDYWHVWRGPTATAELLVRVPLHNEHRHCAADDDSTSEASVILWH